MTEPKKGHTKVCTSKKVWEGKRTRKRKSNKRSIIGKSEKRNKIQYETRLEEKMKTLGKEREQKII